jgi:predicted enzyme related to lactoylglutathione lyase
VLGIDFHDWGGALFLPDAMAGHPGAAKVFSPFADTTDYMEPSQKPFMLNLAVDDLDGVLARCKAHGVEPVKTYPDDGRFEQIIDPEGLKIELWEPKPMG